MSGLRAFFLGFGIAVGVAVVIALVLYFVLDVSGGTLAIVAAGGGGAVGMAYAVYLSFTMSDSS